MLTSVILMLLTLVAVTVSLGACHTVALSTSFHATVRLMAITVLEALRQYLFSPSRGSCVLMTRHVEFLCLDMYFHHTHSVLWVLRQCATSNTDPGSTPHTLA